MKRLLTVYGEIIVGRRFFAEVSRKLGNLWYLIVMVKGKQIVFTQKRALLSELSRFASLWP